MSKTQDRAQQAGRSARRHSGEVAVSAQQQAGHIRDEATGQARDLVRESAEQVRQRANAQTGEVAASLSAVSDDLRAMAQGARDADGALAALARDGSDRLASLSRRLESGGIDGAVEDLRRFGRQRPGLFVGSCLAAGLLVGRALRNADTSSITEAARSGTRSDDGEPATTSGAGATPMPTDTTPPVAATPERAR